MERISTLIGLLFLFLSIQLAAQNQAFFDSLATIADNEAQDIESLKAMRLIANLGPDGMWQEYNDKMGALAEILSRSEDSTSQYRGRFCIGQYTQNMAYLTAQQGDFGAALEYYEQAMAVNKELELWHEYVTVINSIGAVYDRMGESEKALEYYNRGFMICEERELETVKIELLANMASQESNLHHDSISFRYYKEAASIIAVRNDYRAPTAAIVFNFLGRLYLELNDDVDSAEFYILKAMDLTKKIGLKSAESTSLLNMGLIKERKGLKQEAVEDYKAALVIAQEINYPRTVRDVAHRLLERYAEMGEYKSALNMMIILTKAEKRLNSIDNKKAILRHEINAEFEKKRALMELEQQQKEELTQAEIRRQKILRNASLGGLGVTMLFGLVVFNQRNKIKKGKAKSDELLLNILPSEVAEELKMNGTAEAKNFDNVSILFTDFKEFTQKSSELSASELVEEINVCFKAFDQIIEKYGIEKIKTIGDAYMAAGGLHIPRTSEPKDVVMAGLEMQVFMSRRKEEREKVGLTSFEMRAGIHTGPVVAGIVGVKKFQYDIWGDTVNTASRMESNGEEGKVNISNNTYELIKGDSSFSFESRGKIDVKGKGEMDMFFVTLLA
jgi:adenylate cyclase